MEKNTPAEIGGRILTCRARLRFSQLELAKLIGIAPAQFYRYETGRSRPRPEMADRIADALGVSTHWLLTGEGEQERAGKDSRGTWEAEGFHVLSVEFTPSEAKLVRRHAKARGMTPAQFLKMVMYEQFAKNGLLDGNGGIQKDPDSEDSK